MALRIDYSYIVNCLREQISSLIGILGAEGADASSVVPSIEKEIAEYLKETTFQIDDEQLFIDRNSYDPNKIYIVVKFGSASVNIGGSLIPIHLVIHGPENKVKPAQYLMSEFATRYNLKPLNNDNTMTQFWVAPAVSSNFNAFGASFKTLFSVSGNLVIGPDVIKIGYIKYYYTDNNVEKNELVPFIAFADSFANSLEPQPFGNTYGFAKSETNFSTYTFTISTYLLNNRFVRDLMAVKGYRKNSSGTSAYVSVKEPNDIFKMEILFDLDDTNYYSNNRTGISFFTEFKVHTINVEQKIGAVPTLTVGFTH